MRLILLGLCLLSFNALCQDAIGIRQGDPLPKPGIQYYYITDTNKAVVEFKIETKVKVKIESGSNLTPAERSLNVVKTGMMNGVPVAFYADGSYSYRKSIAECRTQCTGGSCSVKK